MMLKEFAEKIAALAVAFPDAELLVRDYRENEYSREIERIRVDYDLKQPIILIE